MLVVLNVPRPLAPGLERYRVAHVSLALVLNAAGVFAFDVAGMARLHDRMRSDTVVAAASVQQPAIGDARRLQRMPLIPLEDEP